MNQPTNPTVEELADRVVYGIGVAEHLVNQRPTQPIIARVPGGKVALCTPAAPLGKNRWVVELVVDSLGIVVIAHGAPGRDRPLMWAAEYVAAVRRYRDDIGGLEWAAPMDWMCEPFMVAKTGLSVREHQARTVASVLELRALGPGLPFAPVVQGWDLRSYRECVGMYADAGVDLATEPVVGLGSVCRRQGTEEIGQIVTALADQYGIALHGFGVKMQGVSRYGAALASSDSMAWSADGRRRDGCAHGRPVKSEANCVHYALEWRERLMRSINPWHQPGLAVLA